MVMLAAKLLKNEKISFNFVHIVNKLLLNVRVKVNV